MAAATFTGGVGYASCWIYSCPGRRPAPMLPAPALFSRLKIVLGSLGTDPGAGAFPGVRGEPGVLAGRSPIAMRLARLRRQDQRSLQRVWRRPTPQTSLYPLRVRVIQEQMVCLNATDRELSGA
jgi:hypothetical protein